MDQYQIRELSDAESVQALQLVLPPVLDQEESIRRAERFLRNLAVQCLKLDWKFAIEQQSRMVRACLGIISPGRTALIMPSNALETGPMDGLMTQILRSLENDARRRGVTLLQVLVSPQARAMACAVQDAGYEYLAELRYLTLAVQSWRPRRIERSAVALETYCSTNESVFTETLGRTHQQSLDCPGLDGLRSLADIMLSHRHTGLHDPALWILARVEHRPIGVLLLTRVPLQQALELVYMGIVPEARGRGYGRRLIEIAIGRALIEESEQLVLAVDRANHFAIEIYHSMGFIETDRRMAWIHYLEQRASGLPGSG